MSDQDIEREEGLNVFQGIAIGFLLGIVGWTLIIWGLASIPLP